MDATALTALPQLRALDSGLWTPRDWLTADPEATGFEVSGEPQVVIEAQSLGSINNNLGFYPRNFEALS